MAIYFWYRKNGAKIIISLLIIMIIENNTNLGNLIRLSGKDDLVLLNNEIFIFSGDKGEKKLELFKIILK